MKVQIKTKEEMPARFLCCETNNNKIPYGKIYEVNPRVQHYTMSCPWCGTVFSENIFMLKNGKFCLQVDMLHIDEGESSN